MKSLREVFNEIPEADLPTDMEERVFRAIALERAAFRRRRGMLFSIASFGSASAFFVAIFWYGKALFESDFWNVSGLLFSDMDVVISHGSDFLFFLLETFPTIPVISLLAPAFVLLLIAKEYAVLRDYRHHQFTYNN